MDGKEWRDFPSIKWIVIKKSESLKKKGWVGGKTKTTWGRMKRAPLRELRIELGGV